MQDELSLNSKVPRLSAFISNYNHERYIGRAIEAMAAQSRPPDELIIVDDGSWDNSVDVINKYASRYSWIRLIARPNNQGVQKVLSESLDLLNGDYVYFGSSDDRVLPGFFEAAMQAANKSPASGIIFGQIWAETDKQEMLYKIGVGAWQENLCAGPKRFRRECLDAEPAGQAFVGSTIFRLEALKDVGGFRPELGSWCDSFAWRALGLRYGACFLSFPCMAWTIHAGSLSHAASRRPAHMLKIVKLAARLMRSPEFRDDFPIKHVQHWRRGYYLIIFEHYILSLLPVNLVTVLSRSKFLHRLRIYLLNLLS